MKNICVWCNRFHDYSANISHCFKKKGGGNSMTKGIKKPSKTLDQRFALKVDKIISTLIQMKPIADTSEKKTMVYSQMRFWLEYQEGLEKAG